MMINLRAFSGPTSNIQDDDDDDDEKRKGFMLVNKSHERASPPSGLSAGLVDKLGPTLLKRPRREK